MRLLKIAVPIAALVAAIFILYAKFGSAPETISSTTAESEAALSSDDSAQSADANAQENAATTDKPTNATDSAAAEPVVDVNVDEPVVSNQSSNTASAETPLPEYPPLPAYEVGVTDISEEAYIELVERLRNDPALLADLLNELRAETDPARLERLTIMLGATGSADVLPVAEELVYSSSFDVRKTGLDLLSRVAPQNPAAYDIANTILGSEADPQVLVSTMNVLARPKNAGSEVKATAISQIMPLANHDSADVRRHSVGMLVRLTNDETLSPVLYTALSDPDASVRKAATYAYGQYPFQTTEAVERLMEIIEDPAEERGVRKGAIFAISTMSPDEITNERIKAAKIQMRDAQQ